MALLLVDLTSMDIVASLTMKSKLDGLRLFSLNLIVSASAVLIFLLISIIAEERAKKRGYWKWGVAKIMEWGELS